MKSFKILATTAAIIGSLTLAAPGFAGDRNFDGKWKQNSDWRHDHGKRMDKLLDLTDAQKEALENQRGSDKAARQAQHAKLLEAHNALNNAAENGANDAELSALAQTLGQLHAEQALASAKAHKAFIAVLTPEQKQKLAELKAKREERKKARDARQHQSSSSAGS